MLEEGIILVCVGMGTVFTFLAILWGAVTIMGKVVAYINKIFPEELKRTTAPMKAASSEVEIAIAIAAAKKRQ